ncbi:MAG TPA: hypothetical protein VFB14_28840 [Bryobacteraceae bacterium]|nr:hypothetical protein [Bryobacteraceae bacterium]
MDLIVLSIPFAAVAELPKDLFDPFLQHVPFIDTGNVFEPLYQVLYPLWSGCVEERPSRGYVVEYIGYSASFLSLAATSAPISILAISQ